jgi:hypothetical protein
VISKCCCLQCGVGVVQSLAIMKHLMQTMRVVLVAAVAGFISLSALPTSVFADAAAVPDGLVLREIKITGDEFVVVQNTSDSSVILSEYWLGYNSSDTATNIVPTVQLPMTILAPSEVVLLNNGATDVCDAKYTADLGISSLSDTKGTLVLRHLDNNGDTSSFTTVDSVSWGKLATDKVQIANEAKLAAGSNPVWYKDPGVANSAWSLGDFSNCTLKIAVFPNTPAPTQQVVDWQQDSDSPPSIFSTETVIAAVVTGTPSTPFIPASDTGLKAPQLSEILPNPASPQTDADDEFIELYNPNAAVFDLSGFQLQYVSSGSATTHTYTFPAGTTLAPFSFKAFLPADTHLSLSNSGGQVWFVDPLGKTITQSDPYGTAKDGQSWVLANGKWQWTTQATPNTTNKITNPATSATTKTATSNGKKITAVKGASTVAATAPTSASAAQDATNAIPIHPLTLVVVVALGLLYGAYEYRTDIANRIYQYRRYRATRRSSRG